jgi:hypothetical protein
VKHAALHHEIDRCAKIVADEEPFAIDGDPVCVNGGTRIVSCDSCHMARQLSNIAVGNFVKRIAVAELIGAAVVHTCAAESIAIRDDNVAFANLSDITKINAHGSLDIAIAEIKVVVHRMQGNEADFSADGPLLLGVFKRIGQKNFRPR